MAFEYLNALDNGEGQAAFSKLGLRGHPSVLIFDASGEEVYRSFGTVEEATLIEEIEQVIGE